jgi:hypothetical protein
MPQVLLTGGIAAGLGALGKAAVTVAPSYLQYRASNKAMNAQEKARQEALAYEKQRQAEQRSRLDRYNQEYQKSWLDWYGRVGDEGLKRFGAPPVGIRIPGANAAPPGRGGAVRMDGSAVAPTVAPASMPAPTVGRNPGVTAPLNQPFQPAPMAPTPQAAASQPGQNLGGWNDWTQYEA